MPGPSRQQRLNPTKRLAKTATSALREIEIGIIHDAGTAQSGLYGLTELFKFASDLAATRRCHDAFPPLRITHWRNIHGTVAPTYDTSPGADHRPSVLIIPGNLQAPVSSVVDEVLTSWLRQMHAHGVMVAANCGGVFILARTGLLQGRQATTHWALHDQFSQEFPGVLVETDYMLIDYGDVLTAGGVLAWADMGLRIVERLLGTGVMLDTAHFMNIDPPGREQRFYSSFDPHLKHSDHAIVKAQQLLAGNSEHAISVADLAKHACLEQRTFLRRFTKATGMKPHEYQQRLRVSRAREMLEITRLGVDEIAARIGYEDLNSFRRVFKRFVGLTPTDYRHRFAGSALSSTSEAGIPAAAID